MKSIAIIGSGPAALMAADVLSAANYQVIIFEKRPGPGRKIFIAGSSGLNITNDLPLEEFALQYRGADPKFWRDLLLAFGRDQWLNFLHELGVESFLGTSGRYFVKTMNAAMLMRLWRRRLTASRVQWHFGCEVVGVTQVENHQIELRLADESRRRFDAVLLALGGASYEEDEEPLRWPEMLRTHDIKMNSFRPSNVGYEVDWPAQFLKEASYQPLKNLSLTTSLGSMRGDLLITDYGLEGTPIYTYGTEGLAHIDLKPDLSLDQIIERLNRSKEKIKPLRLARKTLNLSDTALALLFHKSNASEILDHAAFASLIKSFPIQLLRPRPLSEAISSSGGVLMSEIDDEWMFKRIAGVFAAGEMLDWDAPTGGFLIQACVSQGFAAAQGVIRYFNSDD
jgi:uncharacterized flavoprotein (TIGR03862 family)